MDFDDFAEELKRLSAVNQELLSEAHSDEEADHLVEPLAAQSFTEAEELLMLRHEVAALRERIQELELLAQPSADSAEETWLERQREYETLLEEKSEVIRGLHQKMQELQEQDRPTDNSDGSVRTGGQGEENLAVETRAGRAAGKWFKTKKT